MIVCNLCNFESKTSKEALKHILEEHSNHLAKLIMKGIKKERIKVNDGKSYNIYDN